MAGAIYSEGQPLLDLLQQLVGGVITMRLLEDNAAMLSILHSGYSVRLRHASRTHQIDVASLADLVQQRGMKPEHVGTGDQEADGMTKVVAPMSWEPLIQLLCIRTNT